MYESDAWSLQGILRKLVIAHSHLYNKCVLNYNNYVPIICQIISKGRIT